MLHLTYAIKTAFSYGMLKKMFVYILKDIIARERFLN